MMTVVQRMKVKHLLLEKQMKVVSQRHTPKYAQCLDVLVDV